MMLPETTLAVLGEKTKVVTTRLNNSWTRRVQERLLRKNYPASTERLIIFLTKGLDISIGGILSICSIYEETRKLKEVHKAETIMCTVPGDPLLLKYTKFENQIYIYPLSQVLSYFQHLQYLMIHIPEYACQQFLENLTPSDYARIREMKNLHLNVMLQNIDMLSPIRYINILKKFGTLTCTTAHEKYSTLELSRQLGCPLHKLSEFISPEQYHKRSYGEKENLMIVSPDAHPRKSAVLNMISRELPKLKIQIIQNLTYEEYKKLISRAKWALTFGEGLDGYFVETIFSGGVSYSVFNPKFFTSDFKSLRTVYDNYDTLTENIRSDITDLDNETAYCNYQKKQYDLCHTYYDHKKYVRNLELFYKKEYTYA